MAGVDEKADVVIVGGGPAGTVLATLLAAAGHTPVVFERDALESLALGTGILLQPNGLSVLYGLGLREELHDVSVLHRAVPIKDELGRLIATGEMPDFGEGLDHALALLRPTLQRILWSALEARGGSVRFGCDVHAVDTATGEIEASGDGQTRHISAGLIVGADGIGSIVRRSGDFGARPVKGAHHVFRTVLDGDFNASGSEYWTGLGLFGASPVGEGRTYAYGSANDPRVLDSVRAGDVARLARLWSDALPVAAPLLSQIHSMDGVLLNEVGRVRCRSYCDQRAVLIGDAAHAMAPNLGQGANSALVDAAVLARELADTPGSLEAPGRYDRRRRRPVTGVQRTSDLLASVSHIQQTRLRRVRDRIFRIAGRPALVRRQIRTTSWSNLHIFYAMFADWGRRSRPYVPLAEGVPGGGYMTVRRSPFPVWLREASDDPAFGCP